MEADLVRRAQHGDQRAFDTLATGLAARFHALAYRVLQDSDLAQDATQQALIAIWRDLPRLRDVERFEGWVYRLMLKPKNSEFVEDMGVPFRVLLVGISATTGDRHTLVLGHRATRRASTAAYAYDWLVSYDQAVVLADDRGLPFNDLAGQTCDGGIGPEVTTAQCESLRTGANCVDVDVPDDPYVSSVFGFATGSYQDRIDAFESTHGNRSLRICRDDPITTASLAIVGHTKADDSNGDRIYYELSWTSPSSQLLVLAAAHLASGRDSGYGWGSGLGASSVQGGPYQVFISQLDGTELDRVLSAR